MGPPVPLRSLPHINVSWWFHQVNVSASDTAAVLLMPIRERIECNEANFLAC